MNRVIFSRRKLATVAGRRSAAASSQTELKNRLLNHQGPVSFFSSFGGNNMEINTLLLILLAPIVLAGVWLLAYGMRQRRRAEESNRWSTTKGRVLSSDVRRHAYKSKYGKNVWYTPEIEYEYSVSGTSFNSRRITFGSASFNTEQGAESFLQQLVGGDAIQVHYDPANPKNAVLVAGQAPHSLAFTFAGAALMVFPLLLAIYFLSLS
jgi:hypothetical protein